MKKINKISLVLVAVAILSLVFPAPVAAESPEDGRTIFGESYTLGSGEILDGDLTVFGGVVSVESGAIVTGNVFVLGGVVTINGTVEGNLSIVGGTVTLEDNAVIEGNLSASASYVNQLPGALVEGDITQGGEIPWTELNPPTISVPQTITSPVTRIMSGLTDIAKAIGITLVMVALGALIALVMPKSSDIMTQALRANPWHILGYGALTAAAMVVGGILLTLTICMIPVVILIGLAFLLAVLAGWLALGHELGKLMESGIFKATWHPVLTAALGNLALYLLTRGLLLIPCLGHLLVFVAALFGLGMAVVTLFGTTPYPRQPKAGQPEVLFEDKALAANTPPEDETKPEKPESEPES